MTAFAMAAAFGGLTVDETMADAPWQLVLVDVLMLSAYALVVDRVAARRGLATVVPLAPAPAVTGGEPGPTGPGGGWAAGPPVPGPRPAATRREDPGVAAESRGWPCAAPPRSSR